MNKRINLIVIISIICVLFTGTIIALASQENEFDVPHDHDYQITDFNEGTITFTCEICGDVQTDNFSNHINERDNELIDMNHDGIINAKDYAYLMHKFK